MAKETKTKKNDDAYVRRLQAKFGINCPVCIEKKKRMPIVLLPSQKCKIHHYVDERPPLTLAEKKTCREIMKV